MAKYIRDILITILAAFAIFFLLHATVGSFKVYGTSMLPSIRDGDYIMVGKVAYLFQPPQRGDVIVFDSPRNPGSDLIKRIIGVPGDTVEVKDGKVFVNKKPLIEPYIMEQPSYSYPPLQVPPANYFVLGDNRNNSSDSHIGWFLPKENIIGKAWISYWPPEAIKDRIVINHYPIFAHQ
jgi:signal peptidase I